MALGRFASVLLLTALLFLPVAQAGDGASPELVDPAGDACVDLNPGGPVPSVVPCAPTGSNTEALDITAAWVQAPAPDTIVLNLNVSSPAPLAGAGLGVDVPDVACFNAAADLQYAFHFRTKAPDGTPLVANEPSAGESPLDDVYALARLPCNSGAAAQT